MKLQQIIILTLIAFASCKSLERKCIERFPSDTTEVVRTTLRTDTIITPWHTVEVIDTTVCPPAKDSTIVVKTITKRIEGQTIYYPVECIDTLVVFRDKEKVEWLTSELKSKESLLKAAKKATRQMMFVSIAVGLGFLALVVFLVFRRVKS